MISFDKIFKINDIDLNLSELPKELQSIYVYNRFVQKDESIVFLVNSIYEATIYYKTLKNYTDDVLLFPMDDFITSEALAVSPEFLSTRLETLSILIKNSKKIVITNLTGYLRFLPEREIFKEKIVTLEINQEIDIRSLFSSLIEAGYEREVLAERTGSVALRGFVLDIFPINTEFPIRIEFFGDFIESIKTFDSNTQKTVKEIKTIEIAPNSEFLLKKSLDIEKKQRELIKYSKVVNINDYLDNPKIIINNENLIFNSYNFLKEEMIQYSKDNNEDYIYIHDLGDLLKKYIKCSHEKIDARDIPFFPTNKDEIRSRFDDYLKKNKNIIVCLPNRYLVNKLIEEINHDSFVITNINDIIKNKINIIIKKIESGFEIGSLILVTDKEIFNKKDEVSTYHSNFKIGSRINDITKINIGDYIVHFNHGIGQYLGLKKLITSGVERDYIELRYKGSDKLYIPVEKIDNIKKYSSNEDEVPKLNKLGSGDFEKTKQKIKGRVREIAQELLKLYAERETNKGFSFLPDGELQKDFEGQFEYDATNDQIRVLSEIKKDMESETPMDRILCGDVGFGKTEVAFRAIFKAIMSGKQTSILCPTTILAFQHFTNAKKRFADFPINIEVVNRFVSNKKIIEIKERLIRGDIDLLIGTHRLLSDDIKFKDLGLLVVDEEQRFGVIHKEKLKKYKTNIDVLTLTATPIPRTLKMTFTGIRNLSLIETAPNNRFPVQTYVMPYNKQLIKDAIQKEMARLGQVFILHNRVEDIRIVAEEIRVLAPELRIAIAHGQMEKRELERVMIDFTNHEFDVLICTTIIETGIDIPRVNTLIILESDKFGLSQLYQIRGRVGRSDKIAYCYLMFNQQKGLSDIANKRLNIIKEFTKLGSGFGIAMRDLAIRGAGDILGDQQAGFIDSVGVELFLSMLDTEIKRLRGIEVNDEVNDEVNSLILIDTAINENYVFDEELKVEIHKKINSIKKYDDLLFIKKEIEDRFGKIDEKMNIYMHSELFEEIAKKTNITKIKQNRNYIEIIVPENIFEKLKIDDLFVESQKISRMFRFTTRGRNLVIILDTIKLDKHYIYPLLELFRYIDEKIN